MENSMLLKTSILAFLVSALFNVPAFAWKVEVLAGTLDDPATGKAGKLFGPEILRAYGSCDFVVLASVRGVFYASCSRRSVVIRIAPEDGDWPSAKIALLP
ncbi:MAG TPA: hypothetical protein DCW29_14460 [Janthinobacterium sp.]|nr:hypothetical protein [Janthinobacterium sp.]